MKVYALLLFVVGCRSFQWKPVNDFKDTCEELSKAAVDTILSIEKVIEASKEQSTLFITDFYSKNQIFNRLSIKNSSGDQCFKRNFIQKENLELSYLIQLYQFQIPLQSRIEDIKERLNTFNSSLDIFQALAESKVRNCKLLNGRCMNETNDWLESTINSFSCTIYPDCSSHSIRKRSIYDGFHCSEKSGNFLCSNKLCIRLEKVCDGYNDCGDWSDENGKCDGPQCSSECGRKGGVCFIGPNGSQCLYECPPGTFEASKGCARNPEAPLPTLFEVIADTPRLLTRYTTRVKYLKTKTIVGFSTVLRDIVNCKQREFTLLSRVIDFSTIIHEEDSSLKKEPKVDLAAPNPPDDMIAFSSSSSQPSEPTIEDTTEYTTEYSDYYLLPNPLI